MKDRKLILIGMFLLVGILLFSSFGSSYVRSNPKYTSTYSGSSAFFGANDFFSNDMCNAGQDFILQIDPTGCEPLVVRSDLLEDQNAFVFCPIVATQINPLIDIKAVNWIKLSSRDFSNDVADIGFHPADAALGYDNKINSPVMDNLGYAVIELKRQPIESKMPDFVEGNITAKILYDVEGAFGVGRADFYLNSLNDNEWNKEFTKGSFWNGRGFLRAENIGTDSARISVYSGNSLAKNDKSYHEKISSFNLEKGQESNEVYLPTFDYCMGGLKIKLDDVENVDDYVKLKINGDYFELKKGQKFLDDRCHVKDFEKVGLNQWVDINCDEDDSGWFSSTDFTLRIIPKINLTVEGVSKTYKIGDRVYDGSSNGREENQKSIYLVYAYEKGDVQDENNLVVVLIASPETKDHLSDEDLSHWKDFIERYRTDKDEFNMPSVLKDMVKSPGAFGESVMNTIVDGYEPYFVNLNEKKEIRITSISEGLGTDILNAGKQMTTLLMQIGTLGIYNPDFKLENQKNVAVKLLGFGEPQDSSPEILENDYQKANADFDNLIGNFKDIKEKDNMSSYGQGAFEEKIKLAKSIGKMKTMKEFCDEYSKEYPDADINSLGCLDKMGLSNDGISSKTLLINNKLKEISFKGVYEPSFEDYNAEFQITSKDGTSITTSLGKNDIYPLGGTSENLQNYFSSDTFEISSSLNENQRKDVDPIIPEIVNCMDSKYYASEKNHLVVTSFTDNNLYNGKCNLDDSSEIYSDSNKCVHKETSCHYAREGDVLQSRAVDLRITDFDKSKMEQAFDSCKSLFLERDSSFCSDFILEKDHIHIEAYCGCGDYAGDNRYSSYPEKVLLSSESSSPAIYNEYIQLSSLDDNSAKIIGNVGGRGFASNTFTDNVWDLTLNEPRDVGNYIITLKKINVKKVAKVSVIPKIDYTESEATFKFKIGIEKRNIQPLAPEKLKKKIERLDNSIKDWKKISDTLGKTVKVWKKACIGTEAALTLKNLVQNSDGKGIARQEIMNAEGGWYEKCNDLVNAGTYSSQDECLIKKSDDIQKDVDLFYGVITEQNKEIISIEDGKLAKKKVLGQNIVNTDAFMEEYSGVVRNVLDESIIQDVDSDLDYDNIKSSLSYNNWKDHHTYSVDDLKKIERYTMVLKNDSNNDVAKAGLKSVLNNVKTNAGNYVAQETYASSLNILPSQTSFLELKKDEKVLMWHGLKNSDLGSNKIEGIEGNVPIEVLTTSEGGKYVIILDASFGGKNLPIKKDSGNKLYIYEDNKRVSNYASEFDKIYFKKYDKSSYENEFKPSSGENEVVVRYFETEPYKGRPAVIPFDLDNGWYVASKATLPVGANIASYDKSGKVNSLWLCNVGENGMMEFNSGFGDDICQMINLGVSGTFTQFYGLDNDETASLVSDAVKVTEDVSRQYPAKSGRVKVSSRRGNYNLKVGSPATEIPEIQCQDFMSPKDCNLIFNACDPVICPQSRCDFGGNYPVRDVIQSGIIGSIALCAPNYKEKIYAPVCLTGVQAGVDSWLSVKESYRDCLKQNLETGETIGICDEINSVYMCEFFWRQAMPLLKATIPNLVGLAVGQKSRGGGEYMAFKNAWDNAGKSLDYFTKSYAQNAYAAFKARSSEEAIGGSVCKLYSSIVVSKPEALLDQLSEPDSPAQFSGRFDEIPYTTTTNPPISHYKVFYHIFAGNDKGAYYRVYLREGSQSSFYQDTSHLQMVGTGYIPKGQSNTTTRDFTAPSGYKELCIMVNGQEVCDFKEVSTSFAVNYVQDEYVSEQSEKKDISSESECISGSASLYNFLTPNVQSSAEGAINPAIYNRGIIRICATDNPGVATGFGEGGQEARWVDVGYCDNPKMRCWLDRSSVDDSLKFENIKNKTLSEIQDNWNEALKKSGKCSDDFYGELKDIMNDTKLDTKDPIDVKISSLRERISLISDLMKRACFNKEKAKAYFERGKTYAQIVLFNYQKYLEDLNVNSVSNENPSGQQSTCQKEGGECSDIAKYDCSIDWEAGKCPGASNIQCCKGDLKIKPGEIEDTLNYPIIVYNPGFWSSNINFYFDKNLNYWKLCSGKFLGLSTSKGACSDINSDAWISASKVNSLGTAPSKDIFEIGDKLSGKDYLVGFRYLMRFAKDKEAVLYAESNSLYVEFNPSNNIITLKKDGNKIYLKYDEEEKLGWEWKSSSSSDTVESVDTWSIIYPTGIIRSKFCGKKGSTPSAQKKFDKECKRANEEVQPFESILVEVNKQTSLSSGLDFLFRKASSSLTPVAQSSLDSFLKTQYEKDSLKNAQECGDCSNWAGLKCTLALCSAIKVKTGLNCVSHTSKYLGRVVCEEKQGSSSNIIEGTLSQKFLDSYNKYNSYFTKYAKINLPQGWEEDQFKALLVAISTQETGVGTAGDKCGLNSDESCEDWLMGYTSGAKYPSSYKGVEKQIALASSLLKRALTGASSSYTKCGNYISPNDEEGLKCVIQTYGPSSTDYPIKVLSFWKAWEKELSNQAPRTEEKITKLCGASENGGLNTIELLIEGGVAVDSNCGNGETPLIIASYSGHANIVKYLVEKGANIEAMDDYKATPLIWASHEDKSEIVKYLVEKGANIEAMDHYGLTPLLWATDSGTLVTVKYLVEKGANIEVKRYNNMETPLMVASFLEKMDIVKYLVEEAGAKINAVDGEDKTALDYAKERTSDDNDPKNIINYLVSKGAKFGAEISS